MPEIHRKKGKKKDIDGREKKGMKERKREKK